MGGRKIHPLFCNKAKTRFVINQHVFKGQLGRGVGKFYDVPEHALHEEGLLRPTLDIVT